MQRISFFRWIYLLLTNSFRLGWLCLLIKMWFDQKTVNEIVPDEFNLVKKHTIGRYIFLTHLNQMSHKIAFLALFCADLGLVRWRMASMLFQSYVIPQTTTTFVIYWAMYMKDPSLVRNPKTVEVGVV
ncbi:Oidioi.mRNA.OKI2018_I69.PAR.g12545.t1.cds [Oikopleura dioica]|uniref:Oidioi.mRNA.OKI2018_I69.PAR.g12545.t1.cds n=1 Tax=Oikopleura dioica TaxID=34765 RepID=A0ABN7S873_OIKDI|nr:Oidioi.mRNA.OKI2018_I69.PAR.g12545.t1.cds [Oikopleura dioica]